MQTKIRLIEGKTLRRTRNRPFGATAAEPADRVSSIRQRKYQSDFALTGRASHVPRDQAPKATPEKTYDRSIEF